MDVQRIQVDTAYLGELEQRCRRLSRELSGCTYRPEPTAPGNPVGGALEDFLGRWERTRGEIVEGVDSVATAFATIRESFDEADVNLADALLRGQA